MNSKEKLGIVKELNKTIDEKSNKQLKKQLLDISSQCKTPNDWFFIQKEDPELFDKAFNLAMQNINFIYKP